MEKEKIKCLQTGEMFLPARWGNQIYIDTTAGNDFRNKINRYPFPEYRKKVKHLLSNYQILMKVFCHATNFGRLSDLYKLGFNLKPRSESGDRKQITLKCMYFIISLSEWSDWFCFRPVWWDQSHYGSLNQIDTGIRQVDE